MRPSTRTSRNSTSEPWASCARTQRGRVDAGERHLLCVGPGATPRGETRQVLEEPALHASRGSYVDAAEVRIHRGANHQDDDHRGGTDESTLPGREALREEADTELSRSARWVRIRDQRRPEPNHDAGFGGGEIKDPDS